MLLAELMYPSDVCISIPNGNVWSVMMTEPHCLTDRRLPDCSSHIAGIKKTCGLTDGPFHLLKPIRSKCRANITQDHVMALSEVMKRTCLVMLEWRFTVFDKFLSLITALTFDYVSCYADFIADIYSHILLVLYNISILVTP
jgi:hypothetical protein